MVKLIYLRIAVYCATLAMHTVNSTILALSLREKALEDPRIANIASMQSAFYTMWNVAFQIFYAALSLYCDLETIKNNGKPNQNLAMQFRKRFFEVALWTSSVLVFYFFWTVFLYDREIIYPEYIDKAIPVYSNCIIHGAVLPVVLWEIYAQPRNEPASHTTNYLLLFGLCTSYLLWILVVHAYTSLWPYPFLYMTYGTIYFPIVVIVPYILMFINYWIQWPITKFIWGKTNVKVS